MSTPTTPVTPTYSAPSDNETSDSDNSSLTTKIGTETSTDSNLLDADKDVIAHDPAITWMPTALQILAFLIVYRLLNAFAIKTFFQPGQF